MSSTFLEATARLSYSFASSELNDVDGLKTSFSSPDSADEELSGADYNGSAAANTGTTWAKLPRQVVIHRASSTSNYNTDDITLVGRVNGVQVTETLTPADADGGDELASEHVWDTPPTITIPQQPNATGSFTIGVRDIGPPGGPVEPFMGVKLHADGTLFATYESSDDYTDELPCAAHIREHVRATRILCAGSQTTDGVTCYVL